MSALELELALLTGLSTSDVARIALTAPKRYKVYEIPKRTGGSRTIAQPSRELKALQRILIDIVLSKFPVHDSAAAYEQGRSISLNAGKHRGAHAILKLDFRDFFSSLRVADFDALLETGSATYKAAEHLLMQRLLFWGKGGYEPVCLSIGAPSSPKLSNIIMYEIDCRARAYCDQAGITYTRYADDVTASGGTIEILIEFEKVFRKIISDSVFPRLRFNNKKRGVYVRGQRQMVTGLILTPGGKVSIGRQRKRLISSMVHRAGLGQMTVQDITRLRGLLSFAYDSEPEFVESLRKKYGTELITRLFC